MRVIQVARFGGPEVLELAERPDPVPARGEVVVRIHAASVNPTDLAARSAGRGYIPDLELPFVPGWDLAGVVHAVGDDVPDFRPGDRVCGMIPFGRIGGRVGSYAEMAAVDPSWLAPIANSLTFEHAATLPLNSLTAQQALAFFRLAADSRTLITGASGGVGGFAVRLAIRAGLRVVAVAGHNDEQWVRGLGAAEVLSRNADLCAIDVVDAVFDAVPVGPERSTCCLREGGTAVFTRPPKPTIDPRFHFETVRVQSDDEMLRRMARLLAGGTLRTRVGRVLPLARAAEAHRMAEEGGVRGKIVLTM